MVTSTARQGITNNMWLMYMSLFVEELEKIYSSTGENVDETDEFATLGNRLIYEIMRCQLNWISHVEELPADSPHREPDALQGRKGLSIPYWAMKNCCSAMRTVACSERLPDRLISDRYQSFLRAFSRLPQSGPLSVLRKQMIQNTIHGESGYGDPSLEAVFLSLNRRIDPAVVFGAPDFVDELEKPA